MKKYVGFLIAITGVILFSAKAVLVKLCYTYNIDAVSVLMLRMSFALPIFIVIGIFKSEKGKAPMDRNALIKIFLLGVLGYYGASYFDFLGLKYIDASLERLILFVYPTAVVLLSAVFLKNKITRNQIIAILVTYFGLLIIFLPKFLGATYDVSGFGVIMIVLSAITYASYLVASQHFVPKFGTIRFTTAAMIVSCIVVMIHFAFDKDATVMDLPIPVYVYGFLMAIFSTVVPSYLISEAIRRIGAPKVAIIGSLGPVSTISLSILLLGESISMFQLLGGLIIITGVVWLNYSKKKNVENSTTIDLEKKD